MKRLMIALLVIGGLLLGACAPTSVSEPPIPANFITYTDESGLFSISYPSDWELALYLLEGLEEITKNIITSIESDAPVERLGYIFFAGLPTDTGYMPNVNIGVESLSRVISHDEMVEANIRSLKSLAKDYHEFNRVKTTIDGRIATIIEYEFVVPTVGNCHFLAMVTLVGKTSWIVTCGARPEEFSNWKDDFDSIVRSLRILR